MYDNHHTIEAITSRYHFLSLHRYALRCNLVAQCTSLYTVSFIFSNYSVVLSFRVTCTSLLVVLVYCSSMLYVDIVFMEGRKGHNSVLLFELQFKHLYIRTYYFCYFYYSSFIFIILPLILDSNFTIPIFQFLLQHFTILTLPIL